MTHLTSERLPVLFLALVLVLSICGHVNIEYTSNTMLYTWFVLVLIMKVVENSTNSYMCFKQVFLKYGTALHVTIASIGL